MFVLCIRYLSFFLLLSLFFLSGGCARLPVEGDLPSYLELSSLATVRADTPSVWAPDGTGVALVDEDGLKVIYPETDRTVLLDAEHPCALAWNRFDNRLAAAFVKNGRTLIRVFVDDRIDNEVELPGTVGDLAWRMNGELLAVGVEIDRYSFGVNFRQVLYRRVLDESPEFQTLNDVTLKPLTLQQWGERLNRVSSLALSPWGDEILFMRLHDPPAFPPYLKLILHHLETGEEKVLGELSIISAGGRFAGNGDEVVYSDGSAMIFRAYTWDGTKNVVHEIPGRSLALSPGEAYLWADGQLWQGSRKVADFAPDSIGRFAPDGSRMIIAHGNVVYLLQGLEENRAPILSGKGREAVLKLRRWRSKGLINQEEYLKQRERIEAQ